MSLLFLKPLSVCKGLVLITNAETKPKARDPKTYLLERLIPSAAFQLGEAK